MNYIHFIRDIITYAKKLYYTELFSIYAVAYFVTSWFVIGNIISFLYITKNQVDLDQIMIFYIILYTLPIIFVLIALYKELNNNVSSFIKVIVIFNILLFLSFVYAPPRNADSMRAWLAKINDIILNGEKILRPYAHYNLPDAFTIFHLPVIQIGDGQLFQLCIFTCFCSILILLIRICKYYGNNLIIHMVLLLFIFNPLITLAATVIITDMPVILAFAGIIYSMIYYNRGNKAYGIVLTLLFLAFGLNIKYNTLLIIPALFYWLLTNVKIKDIKNYSLVTIFFIAFLLLNSIYPYLLNFNQIGNPVWPALYNIFPSHLPEFNIVANYFTVHFINSELSILNFIISIYNLLTMPQHINPLVILLIPFLFRRYKYVSFMPLIITCSYLVFLWVMMPRFAEGEKERYFLYLLPIIIPFGIIGFSEFIKDKQNIFNRKLLHSLIIIPSVVYFSFNIYYSIDSLKYLITSDKVAWHKFTWYYDEYDWINKNVVLKDDQQILVYVSQQQTNYLRKRYINADILSGYFKNDKIFIAPSNYLNELSKFNIAYIIVDVNAVDVRTKLIYEELVTNGKLIDLRQSRIFLGDKRILNKGRYSTTNLYKVNI